MDSSMEEAKKIAAEEGWGLHLFQSDENAILKITRHFGDTTAFCLNGHCEDHFSASLAVGELVLDKVKQWSKNDNEKEDMRWIPDENKEKTMWHLVQNGNSEDFFKILQESQVQITAVDTEGNPCLSAISVAFEIDGRCHVAIFLCKKEKECMKDALNLLNNKDVVKVFCDDTG